MSGKGVGLKDFSDFRLYGNGNFKSIILDQEQLHK